MSSAQISFKLMLQASLQAPDGMGAINSAFTGLKCTNRDLFVPTCWLWDISELQKSPAKLWRTRHLQKAGQRSAEGCAWALKRKKKVGERQKKFMTVREGLD